MVDQRHKTLRSFYCEDPLWELYEVMTHDLDCSMDYLINEAMRHYARSRNYSLTGMSRPRQPEPSYEAPGYDTGGYPVAARPRPPTRPVSQSAPTQAMPAVERGRIPPAPVSQSAQTLSMPPVSRPVMPAPAAPMGGYEQRQAIPAPSQPAGGYEQRPVPPQRDWQGARAPTYEQPPRRPAPPRMPPPPPVPAGPPRGPATLPPPPPQVPMGRITQPSRPPLYLFFNGQRYLIDKDRFIIGRGSQNTDLTIRDGNISRKHAAVIYHNQTYYIQDLGSTNGIEYKGTKVESKQIEEGDYFNICDYELRFSYIG